MTKLEIREAVWSLLESEGVARFPGARGRKEKCFVELDPGRLGKNIYAASSNKGAFEFGRQVAVKQMRPVDLVLCGSVAVRRDGARLGKGGGYSDLEYAIALELGIISSRTPIRTTVHPLQIVQQKTTTHLINSSTGARLLRCTTDWYEFTLRRLYS